MAEATCGTCLTCANQVDSDRRINSNASVACQCRDLKFIVLGRLQYLPVTFRAVNRGGAFSTGGTEKDVSGLALAIMRSYLAVSILPRHDIFGVRMLRLPLRKPDEPLVIGLALKVGGNSDLSGVQSDQSNDFPLRAVIAFDVASRRSEAEAGMTGELLNVSQTPARPFALTSWMTRRAVEPHL